MLTLRLLKHIQATNPAVKEIDIGTLGQSSTVTVTPADQQAASQAAIDAFDWSQEAHDAWLEDQQPERKALRQAAAQAKADNDAYLAITSPTNAQTLAQVRRLTQQNNRIIPLVIKLTQ